MTTSINTLVEIGHYKTAFSVTLPDYIRSMSTLEMTKEAAANPAAYGNTVNRTYPCHNKAATFLSTMLLAGREKTGSYRDVVPANVVRARLTKAAAYWDISADITAMQAKVAGHAVPTVMVKYALDTTYGSEHIQRFPIGNLKTVKRSVDAFIKSAVKYPYKWRKQAAVELLGAVADLEGSLHTDQLSYLVKAAGVYPRPDAFIRGNLKLRASIYKSDIRPGAEKLAAMEVVTDPDAMCNLIDRMDREAGVESMYTEGMPMPEEVCFDSGAEQPKSITITLTTGKSYDEDAAKRLTPDNLDFLGEDVVQDMVGEDGKFDLKKLSDVLPTLPRDMAKLVEKALDKLGVVDEEEKKASLNLGWYEGMRNTIARISAIAKQ